MNEKDIKALKWENQNKQISLGNGLYFRIKKTTKVYVIRKMINDKNQVISLGSTSNLSLREARNKASQFSMKQNVSNIIVSTLVKEYFDEVIEPTSKVPQQVVGYLNHIEKEFGHRKVIDITRVLLVSYIKQYSQDRGARSADRMRSYLKQTLAYAVESGYIETSPMDGVSKRITGYIAVGRKRVLSEDEIRMVWSWKNNQTGWQKTEDNVRVIKFLLLTGLRISEAKNGYQDAGYFRIADTKGRHPKTEKRPHWIYLTNTAKNLLPLPKCTATNIQAWLKRKLISEGYENKGKRFTPHDSRRTFITQANECGVLPHIVEKCVNHKLEGMMSVYNHAEYKKERIEAFKKVEKVILEIINSRFGVHFS